MTTTPAVAASWNPDLGQLARDQREDLLDARLDDLRQHLARELARLAPADGRDVDRLLGADQRRQRAAVAPLEVLGVGHGRAQPDRHVVGDVIAPQRQDRRVPDGAVAEERHVGGAAADVDEDDAQLLLVGEEHRLGRGQRLEHDVLHGQPGAVHRADDVLHGRHRAGDDVHLDLQAHARHADRLPHAVLVVDDERLREHVDDLAVLRQVDGAGGLDGALDVGPAHLALPARDRRPTPRLLTPRMWPPATPA